MRKIAAELKIDPNVVRTIVNHELSIKSYPLTAIHLITESIEGRRL